MNDGPRARPRPDVSEVERTVVRHHTLLEHRGGAARVAALLAEGQARLGALTERTFEAPERTDSGPTSPLGAGRGLPAGAVLHLHATADWPAALASALEHAQAGGRVVVTLHDCSLLTGAARSPWTARRGGTAAWRRVRAATWDARAVWPSAPCWSGCGRSCSARPAGSPAWPAWPCPAWTG